MPEPKIDVMPYYNNGLSWKQFMTGAKNDGLLTLLQSKWFGQLRVLDLSENKIGDKAVKALAAHPVASNLRVLKLGDNPFGSGSDESDSWSTVLRSW